LLNTLLQTKFYAPRWDAALVARPRLRMRLDEALQRQLTLISAPAGFGKTVLVSEWLATSNFVRDCLPTGIPETESANNQAGAQSPKFCWLSLDEGDNDPVRFFAHFLAALRTVAPHLGQLAELVLQAPQLPAVETLMPALINDLAGSAYPLIFVLDDYHVVETPTVHQALGFLLDHLPPPLHLVITTRSDPPWRLARLRARHQLCEVRAADLRFRPDEVTDFLNRVMHLQLSEANIAALERHTEGWIAGLQMAALSMQGLDDIDGFMHAFTGSNRYILDYLTDEVIDRQPLVLREFMLRTSILERMCAPLCSVLWDDLQIQQQAQSPLSVLDSQALLEQLEATNLFLLPLDNQRHWFRYHHLFAEVLRHRLRRTQPEQVALFYQRASAWCEQAALWDEAIGYAFAAKDFDQAARLLAAIGLSMVVETNLGKLLRWVAQVPADVRQAYPRLTIAYVWALLWAGQLEMVEPLLQQAQARPDNPPFVVAHAAAMRSFLASLRGDLTTARRWAQEALRVPTQSDDVTIDVTMQMVRGIALVALGDTYRLLGDLTAAGVTYEEAIPLNVQMKNLYAALGAVWSLGDIAQAQGQLQRAADIYRDGLAMAHRFQVEQGLGDALVTHFIHLQLGAVLYQANRLDEAAQHLERAVQLYELSGVLDLLPAYAMLARLKVAQGEIDAARQLLPKVSVARKKAIPQLAYARAEAERIRLQLLLDSPQPEPAHLHMAIEGWIAARGLRFDDDLPYVREFEYAMLARALVTLNSFEAAHMLLQRLVTQAESGERGGDLIEYLVIQALTLRAQGQMGEALAPLQRALDLAEPAGYIRVFVDEGLPMRALLVDLRAQILQRPSGVLRPSLGYIDRILDAFPVQALVTASMPSENPKAHPQNLLEPLTARELEVLPLLAQGLTNQEIAQQLIISSGTAKRHVANIFAKLAVVNRTQAINRAREEHLL
jgi:LuxR family transcriptional regulator, maltose regulon positive regulatory protein